MASQFAMTVQRTKDAIVDALDNDDDLYDMLPGDGQDDMILGRIFEIIRKLKVE